MLRLMWRSKIGKEKFRSSQNAFFETHRELESQRMQVHQANQWADQAQGEKQISEANRRWQVDSIEKFAK